MRKLIPVYIRIPLLFTLMFGVMEYFIDSGNKPAFIKYPVVSLFLAIFLFTLIAIEVVLNSVDNVSYQLMSEEEKKAYDEELTKPLTESSEFKKIMFKFTDLKPLEQEKDLELDHDFDGIKELDNGLPPWFSGLFYATIIFAIIYLVRFHVIGDYTQDQEFVQKMEQEDKKVAEYLKTAPDLMSADKVTLLTDDASLAEGKEIFTQNCVACHKADGGGQIGPNLTDPNWILGGGIKNVFTTVTEGGRPGKGMVPWKELLKPTQIQKVASYVLSLQGSNPAGGKAPEGDIWKEDGSVAKSATTDSTAVAKDSVK